MYILGLEHHQLQGCAICGTITNNSICGDCSQVLHSHGIISYYKSLAADNLPDGVIDFLKEARERKPKGTVLLVSYTEPPSQPLLASLLFDNSAT